MRLYSGVCSTYQSEAEEKRKGAQKPTEEYEFWKWQLYYCYHPLITSQVISVRNESRLSLRQTNTMLISVLKQSVNSPDVNEENGKWARRSGGEGNREGDGGDDEGREIVTDKWKADGEDNVWEMWWMEIDLEDIKLAEEVISVKGLSRRSDNDSHYFHHPWWAS